MIYRTEHPKPQFFREKWLNLNGLWGFQIDNGNSGEGRGLHKSDAVFSQTITVPFCPESQLSGIGNVDFMNSVWYQRKVNITAEQLTQCVKLHFGAVDYFTTVYVNGKKCGTHKGGYVSFWFDISPYLVEGENVLTVHAEDDVRNRMIPCGKQSDQYASYGCLYTRTTGIWQTVWLEFMPKTHIVKTRYITNIDTASVEIMAFVEGCATLRAEAYYQGRMVGSASCNGDTGVVMLNLQLSEKHLWEVGNGRLYDLVLYYGEDTVKSYFGLRSITLKDKKFLINEKSVFQRLVLDQGFYPDGIYTAPSEDALVADIYRSMAMGFNGGRLHEKVFEERFFYHCDRLGYMVWGEYPNWGLDHSYADSIYGMLPEWIEEIERDFNHPAIVCWCPFNETGDKDGRKQYDDLLGMVYWTTKAIDPTRPCIDASGFYHVITDIYDLHDYEQDPIQFAENCKPLGNSNTFEYWSSFEGRQHYDGNVPFMVSEYGGIRWTQEENGWGYGNAPKTPEEFLNRLKGLTDVLMDNPLIMGMCYTQLTDIEQEQNGLYTYDRKAKFPPEKIAHIFQRPAAIEEII